MKLLETIFFYFTIITTGFFLLLILLNLKKIKAKPKYRNRLLKYLLISFTLNGAIFGGLKMINNKNNEDRNSNSNYSDKNKTPDNSSKEENNEHNNSTSNNQSSTEKPIKPSENKTNEPSPTDKPVTNTNGTTSKGFTIEIKDGITYIDGYMIANKTYPLPENYVPSNTYKKITNPNGACAECLINDAYTAYTKLKKDATSNGLNLWIASGFRSYKYQEGLYNNYVKNRGGKEKADTFSARPGHSEHQTGYAFDLNSVDSSFAETKEGIWINENCYKYGFIIRYPKGKDNETGYKYEPWHLRYVGIDLATKLYNAGDWITMEDYFGITSTYAN